MMGVKRVKDRGEADKGLRQHQEEHCGKEKSQQTREAVNERVMKPCRWGQVIYYE